MVYAGTEPGAIFRSTDNGETFSLEQQLWDHPHRKEWGAGFGGQAFHTFLPHPTDASSVTAAISTGGVYRTTDGGSSWEPRNQGIRADFLPEGQQYPEFGQCVHKVTRHPSNPDRMYLQNHGGVYRSDDEGGSWQSIADGLSSDFGFPVVVHPHEPDTIYVFPVGGEGRFPPEGKPRVWRSRDAGDSWSRWTRASRRSSTPGRCATRCAPTSATRRASTSVAATAPSGGPPTRATRGQVAANLPDVMVVRAAAV